MKYSIGMQWTQKQTILIYIHYVIIILQFKSIVLYSKMQSLTFSYYVQTNSSSVIEGLYL